MVFSNFDERTHHAVFFQAMRVDNCKTEFTIRLLLVIKVLLACVTQMVRLRMASLTACLLALSAVELVLQEILCLIVIKASNHFKIDIGWIDIILSSALANFKNISLLVKSLLRSLDLLLLFFSQVLFVLPFWDPPIALNTFGFEISSQLFNSLLSQARAMVRMIAGI